MINEVNAVAFRQNLGEMLNQVQYRHDSILIKLGSMNSHPCDWIPASLPV